MKTIGKTIAMENPLKMGDLMGKSSISMGHVK
jgi:hypothetical protein